MSIHSIYRLPLFILVSMALTWPNELPVGLRTNGDLDHELIKRMYYEAEFALVSQALENFLASSNNPSREDRIFAYKYLSVINASSENTRQRAESYMYQLLRLNPEIDLIDLYISEHIESIFNKVKDRFVRMEQLNPGQATPQEDTLAITSPAEPVQKVAGNNAPGRWVWYAAGGAGLVAAITLYAFSLDEPDNTPTQQILIPLE